MKAPLLAGACPRLSFLLVGACPRLSSVGACPQLPVLNFPPFVGHKIEGAKPSFLEDIQFLLVGLAWLLHFIHRKVGIRS